MKSLTSMNSRPSSQMALEIRTSEAVADVVDDVAEQVATRHCFRAFHVVVVAVVEESCPIQELKELRQILE